ncbi:MAG: hypothetical protein WAZ98_06135 [Cyclobacteriaceae bacterium]
MYKALLKPILLAGLIVGTLDITAAIIQTLIAGGDPMKMLQFIASGVFGREAFEGGTIYSFYGLFFHYCIATGWTILFFLIYPKLKTTLKNTGTIGVVYGLFVWLMMNRVVLPISNTPPIAFKISKALVSALVLIVAIGLPLSFLANKYYTRTGQP